MSISGLISRIHVIFESSKDITTVWQRAFFFNTSIQLSKYNIQNALFNWKNYALIPYILFLDTGEIEKTVHIYVYSWRRESIMTKIVLTKYLNVP